jgi:hypothetical protein
MGGGGRGAGGPGEGDERDKKRDCSELERQWQAAKARCDEAAARADELSKQFDTAKSRSDRARRERDGLPSEETRVELPDGTSLSQLDLELRRAAARGAWDAYMADPNAASAAAAEDAWREQATPEWLAEQRRAHQARKEALDAELEAAKAELAERGRDLAKARDEQQSVCDEAADARRRLDECLKLAAAAAAAAASPPPSPPTPPPTPPTPPTTPPPSGGPPPSPGGEEEPDQDRERPCPEGTERWQTFDGPHPFTVLASREIRVTQFALIAGQERASRLASLDAAPFTIAGAGGRTVAFDASMFETASPEQLRESFSGPGGLAERWRTAGAGAVQRLAVTLAWDVRRVQAFCDRKEVCENGRWQPRAEWRSRVDGPVETRTASATIVGNIQAGVGRTEADYLAEIVGFLARVQNDVRVLREATEIFESYQRDCRAGRR